MKKIKLKQCNQCGAPVEIGSEGYGKDWEYWVDCTDEDCDESIGPFDTKAKAVKAWNSRVF